VYTPEINGILNILQAKDKLKAAQTFAFVTAYSSCPNSRIQPTWKVFLAHLNEFFKHTNVADLKKLVQQLGVLSLATATPLHMKSAS
jgi:hypothetical protein